MVELGPRLVTRLITGIELDRCRQVLIVQEGEERDVQGVIGRDAGAGRLVALVQMVANPYWLAKA